MESVQEEHTAAKVLIDTEKQARFTDGAVHAQMLAEAGAMHSLAMEGLRLEQAQVQAAMCDKYGETHYEMQVWA